MSFNVVVIAFMVFYGEQLLALPFQTLHGERTVQNPGELSSSAEQMQWIMDDGFDLSSSVVNVSTINDDQACIPPVIDTGFIDMGCKSKIVYDDFQENRLPQMIPQIKCVSSLPALRYRSRHARIVCKEVTYSLPVIYRTETKDDSVLQYKSSIDNISVACIRSRQTSWLLEKMSPNVEIANID